MRTPVLVVSMLILVLGLTYLVILAIGPQEKTVVQAKYVTQTPPQTIVVTHNDEIIKDLRSQVDSLQKQVEQQRLDNYYREEYYRDYYRDYYDDRDDDEYDLTVYVEDEDGDPIEDARVVVEDGDREVEYTDRDGEAEFRNLEEDCYDIEVEADGYDDEYDDICLSRDRSITIELQD